MIFASFPRRRVRRLGERAQRAAFVERDGEGDRGRRIDRVQIDARDLRVSL